MLREAVHGKGMLCPTARYNNNQLKEEGLHLLVAQLKQLLQWRQVLRRHSCLFWLRAGCL